MNLALLYNLWNFRRELKLVAFSVIILIMLPIVAVIILTNAGIDVVSDKLASINTQTQKVDIHDPLTGKVISQVSQVMEWPVAGVVTLEFGESDWPYQPFHTGIDIANPQGKIGDPIIPFMAGTVTYAGEIFWGYGKYIQIDHGNNISSLYGHLSKIYVYTGEKVVLGQVIGEEGSTGWSTGPHLHFQINIFGIPVNPRTFLGDGNPN
jgi:murein DD-endopeptidase MepM/ murein hydrolase activator NlpD